ncbi:MAG: NnrU family protein [Pararhodobacter sp.]|nr:NnrU family protein [Pararhodobacter sp.]
MQGWTEFVAAMIVFLGAHAIPVRSQLKTPLVALLGQAGFGIAYSVLSIALLTWVIIAAGRAPYLPLWAFAPWHGHAALALMLAASLLAAYAIAGTNPLSFGSRAAPFDPARPGIAGVCRHPMLLALALWGATHLLANGDLAHVILFGTLTGFALLGMPLIDRRKRRDLGAEVWRTQARATALVPFAALLTGRWRPQAGPTWRPALAAAIVWALLLYLHPLVIGVDPLAAAF